MRIWLKLIGSAKKPITEWQKDYVGFRKANKPGIRAGDRLFLYAPGGSRRIFALAEALGDPEHTTRATTQTRREVVGGSYVFDTRSIFRFLLTF